jgi:hypothetical protein
LPRHARFPQRIRTRWGPFCFSLAEEWPIRADDLDEEPRAAIREGIAQAKRGEFVPGEEIQALWQRYGL